VDRGYEASPEWALLAVLFRRPPVVLLGTRGGLGEQLPAPGQYQRVTPSIADESNIEHLLEDVFTLETCGHKKKPQASRN